MHPASKIPSWLKQFPRNAAVGLILFFTTFSQATFHLRKEAGIDSCHAPMLP
jgi:hypothetical protein